MATHSIFVVEEIKVLHLSVNTHLCMCVQHFVSIPYDCRWSKTNT